VVKTVVKPWGRELWIAYNARYAGKFIYIKKGESLSKQYHVNKHETLYILYGKAVLLLGEKSKIITHTDKNRTYIVPPGTTHRIKALTECVFVEFSSPELDDVIRLEDNYGRDTKSSDTSSGTGN
jgi:mannose-6-phosphate isomerase-like protein (cupin superfamily)